MVMRYLSSLNLRDVDDLMVWIPLEMVGLLPLPVAACGQGRNAKIF
jgi:hypothetical protein